MKKMIFSFILGIVTAGAIFGLYAHNNMVNLNKVNHVEETNAEWNIVLDDGNIYTIEK